MDEKALAIFDMALKISQNTPTDVFVRYSPHVSNIDVDIHWSGWKPDDDNMTRYTIPIDKDTHYMQTDPDEMLRILGEIWVTAQEKEEIA